MRSGRIVAQSRHNDWSLALDLVACGWLPWCILRRVISAACSRQTAWQVCGPFQLLPCAEHLSVSLEIPLKDFRGHESPQRSI